jgi:hypothetical protein
MKQKKKPVALSSALEQLAAEGYHIADKHDFFEKPEASSAAAEDWKLDLVQPAKEDGRNAMVIAVSSASRRIKLVFVEYFLSMSDFWPTDLLQKLFPKSKQ